MLFKRTIGCAILASLGAWAQTNTGTILGVVTDISGSAIPAATVTIANEGTGVSMTFQSLNDGSYVFPYLLPGTYRVTVTKTGFKTQMNRGISLLVDQKARVDVRLEVGNVSETVQVAGTAPLVETDSSEMGEVITSRKMVELPMNTRDFAQLVSLNAGAVPGKGGLGGAITPNNLLGVSDNNVNGLPVYANNFQVDGVSANQDFFGTLAVNPSLDAIQEFKVTNNNYAAEYGRAGAANVLIAIKSGTNRFHGVAFEFLRNSALDANDFFSNRAGRSIPPFRQNQFGANLGGPLQRDKTFFFVDYEGLRNRLGQVGVLTVPTALQRAGNFSELNPLTAKPQPQIYDPVSHAAYAGNIVPAVQIRPVSTSILKLEPLPNLFAPNGQPLLVNNYFATQSLAHDLDKMDARVDRTFGPRDQAFARYSFGTSSLDNPPYLGTAAGGDPLNQGTAINRTHNLALSEVHTFSARTLNEFRFGLNRFYLDFVTFDQAQNLETSKQVGIPGINDACGFCSGLSRITISGSATLGHGNAYTPSIIADTLFQYVDNVTLIRGKHTIKFGGQVQRYRYNLFSDAAPTGIFTYDQNLTSNRGGAGTGIGLASFLTGYYVSGSRQIAETFPSSRGYQYALFAQDDIHLAHNLTLNLGLRYELYPPNSDRYNALGNFDLATGDILIGCVATSCTGGVHTDLSLWEPRIGFSYSPDNGKTAIRSGFGVSGYSPAFGGQIGTLQQNYPFINGQILTPPSTYEAGPNIAEGFPAPPAPQQRVGAPAGHIVPQGGGGSGIPFAAIFYMDPHAKMPRVYQWSFDVQRTIGPSLVLDAGYVGNASTSVFLNIPGNVPAPGSDPMGKLSLQQRRPYYGANPQMGQFTMRINGGRSTYNALQVKLEKRFSGGLSFLASYTFSKTLTAGTQFVNPAHYMSDKAPAAYDTPHRFVISYAYQMPFGRGGGVGNQWNKAEDLLLGGWEVSGITSYMSGFPYQPSITSNLDNGYANVPNRICNGTLSNPTIDRWYDTGCFVTPPTNVYGNRGFGILRGPSYRDLGPRSNEEFPLYGGAISSVPRGVLQFAEQRELCQPELVTVRWAVRGGRNHQHRRDAAADPVRNEALLVI